MTDLKLLPSGARADREFAQEIASSQERLQASHAYWLQQFNNLTGQKHFTAENEFRRFADNVPVRRLMAIFPERKHLTETEDSRDMCEYATCLLSSEEIRTHLKVKSLWDMLQSFEEAAQEHKARSDSAEAANKDVANGIMAAREYFDLIRRVLFCKFNAARLGLDIDELLALYRREGALVIPPPQNSFEHAPVIETNDVCRPENILVSVQGVSRPAFNLRFPVNSGESEKKIILTAVTYNLLATGGLDTIVSPRSSRKDELGQIIRSSIYNAIYHSKDFPGSNYMIRLNTKYLEPPDGGVIKLLQNLIEGLAKTELELHQDIPAIDILLDAALKRLDGLIDTHRIETREGFAFLLAADKGEETRNCLEVTSDWYSSRKTLRTLLAYQDRSGMAGLDQTLSTFATYLRYNLGDLLFVYNLSCLVFRLGNFYKSWPKNKKHKLNAAVGPGRLGFREALENSNWFQDEARREELIDKAKKSYKFWCTIQRKEQQEREKLTWHFVGISCALRANAPDKQWKNLVTLSEYDQNLQKVAQQAATVVRPIAELNLLNPLCVLLEFLPLSTLKLYGLWRKPLAKAHSFEQLRMAYRRGLPDELKK